MKTCVRVACVVTLLACATTGRARAGDFFFRDGDRLVVVGDSITVQGNYVRYIENFIRTRFPTWKLMVRNAGINGYRADLGFPVMDNDVLIWRPTAVVVNYGMNDGRRRDGVELYTKWIVPYVDKLLEHKARVVLCSNSPLDVGDPPGTYTNYNRHFVKMAAFAKDTAAKRGIPFVDQFNFLHPIWGRNWQSERPVPVTDHTRPQHSPDSVHARAPGQLMMAYIILRTLHAPGEVSHAAIDVATGKVDTRRCEIRELKTIDRGLSFVRADEASPCWIDDRGALGMQLVPFQEELNRMGLAVRGLPAGEYTLKIEGQIHGRFTAQALARGVNLSLNRASPVYDVGRRVEKEVITQKGLTYSARLSVLLFRPPAWLAIDDLEAQRMAAAAKSLQRIDQQDAAIAAAAQPKPQRYEIARAADGGAQR